jgi:hypothetical protein
MVIAWTCWKQWPSRVARCLSSASASIHGRRLLTLRDAATYITKLPEAEHSAPEWQAATEALVLDAETGGPTMLARIGVMRALNRRVVREFTDRKDHHWGKRKLKRDQ